MDEQEIPELVFAWLLTHRCPLCGGKAPEGRCRACRVAWTGRKRGTGVVVTASRRLSRQEMDRLREKCRCPASNA